MNTIYSFMFRNWAKEINPINGLILLDIDYVQVVFFAFRINRTMRIMEKENTQIKHYITTVTVFSRI